MPSQGETGLHYCRDIINDPDAPTITAPSYKQNQVDTSRSKQYKLIKKDVPITSAIWTGSENRDIYEHLIYSFKQPHIDPKTGERFVIRIPNGAGGRSYEFPSSLDTTINNSLIFSEYGIVLLYHVDDQDTPITLPNVSPSINTQLHVVDIYKAIDTPQLPDWVSHCIDYYTIYSEDGNAITQPSPPVINYELYYPKQNWSPFKSEEQLAYFLPKTVKYVVAAWWVPHCKPAIYFYPEQEIKANVQVVIPQGEFLYTDPVYPEGGWNIFAKPNGDIIYRGNLKDSKGKVNYGDGVFPYLYYEARIHDSAIEKPTKGFVKKYEELSGFYNELLPKLGLNAKETKEFKEYWLKALPKSPYYFIGIVSQKNLDEIEPLTITPKQDTTIRVSLYFEALDKRHSVKAPEIQTPERKGFTVVEWGGMFKRDQDHSFTCLQ